MTKVCIYGAGAIGGLIGYSLCAANKCTVSVIARNETLAAIKNHGWRVRSQSGVSTLDVTATDCPKDLGIQDFVIITVKNQSLVSIANSASSLIGPNTQIITAINGIPWWFDDGIPALNGKRIEMLDPNGVLSSAFPIKQIIGCVVHASAVASDDDPGFVAHMGGNQLIFGTPMAANVSILDELVALFEGTNLEATTTSNIRKEIWIKLWGNMTTNPISAITGATIDKILADDLVRNFCTKIINEAKSIGELIGIEIDMTAEERHGITSKLGAFRSSMLQDADRGKPLELDAILTAVAKLAQLLEVEVPNIDILLGMARLFARSHGLYPE